MRYRIIVAGGLLTFVVWVLLAITPVASAYMDQPATQASTVINSRIPVSAETGERIARSYLLERAESFGLSQTDVTELVVDINFADSDSGNRYVKFMQAVGGIEIYNAMLNVTILPNGTVLYVGNRGVANIAQNINSRAPTLSQSDAIAAAAVALGLAYDRDTVTLEEIFGTTNQKVQFTGGDLSLASISVRLMYQPREDGTLRLAWNLDIYETAGLHWWEVRVDALTGELLDKSDRAISDAWDAPHDDAAQVSTGAIAGSQNASVGTTFADNLVAVRAPVLVGTYNVFGIPLESPNHGSRSLVANPDNATASPFGWHDTNGVAGAEFTTTQGNNTQAYTDIDANNAPDAGSSPDGGAGLVFDNPLDLTLPPSGYRPAAVTNLFYWTNILHDVSYVHGFTEAARNFQENNYGRGGLGSDYINGEAQDGSETNNARYFHAAEGTNPRFQMYVWTPPTPDRDGDFDSGIIMHEYGHGISLRLTGNGVSCLNNNEQMGEGWSDFQSVMLTQRAGDTATTNRGVGTYALNQPITGTGIRPAPYNTDMSINSYTYSNLPAVAIPHGVGFVWNTMLWDLNWKLIGEHGFNADIYGDWTTGGNNLTYRLVHDAMKIQPCSPGFVDGRDTILAADVALTGGENACLIWEAFARRGLGSSASQGSSGSTSDGTAAFDLPAACTGGPTPTPTATVSPTASPTPGTDPDINVNPSSVTETHSTPPQTTNQNLTIGNTGGATLEWDITEEDTTIVTANQKPYVPSVVGNAPAAQGANSLTNSAQGGAPYRHTLVPVAGSTTVTHSSSQDIVPLNSVSCNNGVGHTDNSYYRVFDLAGDFGINDTFTVNEVSFGVEQATGATGSQPVSVKLYTLTGAFVLANLTAIGQEDITVADTTGTIETVAFSPAVVVPANSTLVVEIFTPDGQTAGNLLFIGSNPEAQTDPSYLRAATCGISEPTDTAAIGFPDMHIVLNATGDVGGGGGACSAPSDIPWLTVSPTSGSTAPGGSSNVTLTFNSTGLVTGAYIGNLCIESNDPDEALVTVPVTLNVGPPTAIDLSSLTQSAGGLRIADFAAAGILLLAGGVLLFRRRQ